MAYVKYYSFTIAICTYNRAQLLKKCIDSILAQNYSRKLLEILVIDDCSSDDTHRLVLKIKKNNFDIHINYLRIPVHKTVTTARNEALRRGMHKRLIFIDDDVYMPPLWLQRLNTLLDKYPHYALIGGPIIPTLLPEVKKPMWLIDEILEGYAFAFLNWNRTNKILKFPESLHTANCYLNLSLLGKEAYFDERFGESQSRHIVGEDIELNWRLIQKGYRILFHQKLKVNHLIPQTKISVFYILRKCFYWGRTEAKLHSVFIIKGPNNYNADHLRELRLQIKLFIKSVVLSFNNPLVPASEIAYHLGYLQETMNFFN